MANLAPLFEKSLDLLDSAALKQHCNAAQVVWNTGKKKDGVNALVTKFVNVLYPKLTAMSKQELVQLGKAAHLNITLSKPLLLDAIITYMAENFVYSFPDTSMSPVMAEIVDDTKPGVEDEVKQLRGMIHDLKMKLSNALEVNRALTVDLRALNQNLAHMTSDLRNEFTDTIQTMRDTVSHDVRESILHEVRETVVHEVRETVLHEVRESVLHEVRTNVASEINDSIIMNLRAKAEAVCPYPCIGDNNKYNIKYLSPTVMSEKNPRIIYYIQGIFGSELSLRENREKFERERSHPSR